MTVPAADYQRRDIKRAALWLLFLGPFFFATYNFANWLASQHGQVASIVFDWEKHIPFIPWTIIPYWVIDAFYAVSLFICASRQELDAHGKRLLVAQIVAVVCFIAFPLHFSFERPETGGLSGELFTALSSFDQPYNQAPSLHIALLVLLWELYRRHLPRLFLWPFHLLAILILVSVLTTYQHHFIDIPTGALLGWICVWLWPLHEAPVYAAAKWNKNRRAWRIAGYYSVGAAVLVAVAFIFAGAWLWLLWPAVSFLLVALNYSILGSRGFQKDSAGRISLAAKWLFAPYMLGALLNSLWWTRGQAKSVLIMDGVHIGRMPSSRDLKSSHFVAIIDLTAEFTRPNVDIPWHAIPCLDLLTPAPESLTEAAALIDRFQRQGEVLVVCALGYSRSALAITAWMLQSHRARNIDDALAIIRQQRPRVVINDDASLVLNALC